MNWGKGLMIGMALFMSFILYMVFTLMSKSVDLESADYYKKELAYETEISQMRNSASVEEKVKIYKENEFVVVEFPTSLPVDKSTIEFKRPNNEKKDFELSNGGTQRVLHPMSRMENGLYKVNVQFSSEGKEYLVKSTFYR
jgi:nitrogen fixation protein FixH